MSWFEEAKKLLKKNPELTYKEVAAKFGKAEQTLKNRMCLERKKELEGEEERKPLIQEFEDNYIITSGKRVVEITKDQLRTLKRLYCEQKMTINQVCRIMGIPRPEFMVIKSAFGITKDDVPYIDEDLLDKDIDELVDETLERRKRDFYLKLQEQEYKRSLRELEEYRKKDYFTQKALQEISTELEGLLSSLDFKLPPSPPASKKSANKCLVVNLSDLHVGKLILGDKIITGNNYNQNVFDYRMDRLIQAVVEHIRSNSFKKIYVINYGDGLDDPDAKTYEQQIVNQYIHGEQQVVQYVSAIIKLLRAILEVHDDIEYIGLPGNHSKGYTNWDNLGNQMVELFYTLLGCQNIKFDCTDKAVKIVPIMDSYIIATHGKHIRNSQSGGEIDVLSLLRMYGVTTEKAYVVQGHLHHMESTKYMRVLLPSFCGADDLAENILHRTSRPAQILFEFDETGLSCQKYIYLDH